MGCLLTIGVTGVVVGFGMWFGGPGVVVASFLLIGLVLWAVTG